MTCMLALLIVELTTGCGCFFLLGVVLLSLASVVSPLDLLFIVAGEVTAAWRTRVEGLESPHLRDLAESLPTVLASQVAPRSAAKYASAAERWEEWAGEHGLRSIPADSFQLSLYLTELMQVSRSPAPVLAAVYGVAWAHKAAGVPDPTQDGTVQQVVRVARRVLARTPVRKKPLRREDIKALFVHLNSSSRLADLQTLTLIVLGYAAFLRFDDLRNVFSDEITFHDEHRTLFLETRKNDQVRHGSWIIVARWRASSPLCPVALTERLLKEGRHTGHAHLFGKATQGRKGRNYIRGSITYTRAREAVREAMSSVGLKCDEYGLHSLRSGGVSEAAAAGVPDRLIKRHGGWRSDQAMAAYFEETLPSLMSVSRSLQPV